MNFDLEKMIEGYALFRQKYALGDQSIMKGLWENGQYPKAMVIACCDSRVDPALILQCDPGDLFVVRNVANIVPPYEKDGAHHGTSAALEFGICYLNINTLILLGHSQCGGIQALLNKPNDASLPNDFISPWVSQIRSSPHLDVDTCAKFAVHQSFENCMTFPWMKEKYKNKELDIHQWFFDIKQGQLLSYKEDDKNFQPFELCHEKRASSKTSPHVT